MATWAYPQIPPDKLRLEEEKALTQELEWLLRSFQTTLTSLREGLEECATLLAPAETGSTLVLSSMRSESVKGFVTRVGTKIVKGDINLRLNSLPPPAGSTSTKLNLSSSPNSPTVILSQLVTVRDLIDQSLDVVDVSTYTGDPLNASFIYGQLRLLRENLSEARLALKGEGDETRGKWWETSVDENAFDPPLPPHVSFHLSIADAALVLYLRTLEPNSPSETPATVFAPEVSLSGFSIRERFFGTKRPHHDETGDVFDWNGQEVTVREKVRVESQDPSLMAAMAKLNALEHEVAKCKSTLATLMGEDDTESD
ncbi:hypothetical protein FQN54_003534 [Arachnomyces sp. PD_36]|nr:hypothetical protein FQN54_003534 [Arachnomyces sp. PD_36]